jgi:ubiquinone/menaquinone biosynthesis C-methylase UbiE
MACLFFGCGDGTLSLAMQQHGARRVSGCDTDARMVARAQAHATCCGGHIDLIVARSQALPYPDQSFDVVTCITVLTFISNPDIAVREMARVLRHGGRLVIGDLGKWELLGRAPAHTWLVRRTALACSAVPIAK